jgi:hypothetical protein
MRRISLFGLSAVVASLLAPEARAVPYQPPPDFSFRQWAVIDSADACRTPLGARPVCGQSAAGDLSPFTSTTNTTSSLGTISNTATGSASSSANTMRASLSLSATNSSGGVSTTSGNLNNSMFDTYTYTDPALLFGAPTNVTLTFSAEGFYRRNQVFSLGGVTIEVGTFDGATFADPRCPPASPFCTYNEDGRVTPLPGATAFFGENLSFAGASEAVPFAIAVVRPFAVLNGVPYDVAYGLNISGFNIFVDASSTAHIDWELPAGTTLTSVLGWTDPDAAPAPSGIAEPASLTLLGGLAALLALRRRRLSRAL